MIDDQADWTAILAALWAAADYVDEEALVEQIDRLVAPLGEDDPVALFERARARDGTGRTAAAVTLYEQALAAGLSGERRRRAAIQLASSLRCIGQTQRSLSILTAERDAPSDTLDDAVSAFLALTLVDLRQERAAVALLLRTLSRHMTRYQQSLDGYAAELECRAPAPRSPASK